jgi:hypothetical protein
MTIIFVSTNWCLYICYTNAVIMKKRLVIRFEGIESLHPDEAEVVDVSLTGVGTAPNTMFLKYKATLGDVSLYEFGEDTTIEYAESAIADIKATFPTLKVVYIYEE